MPPVKSSADWLTYFQSKSAPRTFGPAADQLTDDQRATIQRSIQEFQLGESGEGQHIMRQAKKYAARTGDTAYVPALRLFIAEEIRHSRELLHFMQRNAIPPLRHTVIDSLFRKVRRAAGLELSIAVLVCAEIIAKVYYAALHNATNSPHLRALCQQILTDEDAHIQFQCERLALLRHKKSRLALALRALVYPLFFRLTLLAIWPKHRRVFRGGNFPFRTYWRSTLTELHHATPIMNPHTFTWLERPSIAPSIHATEPVA